MVFFVSVTFIILCDNSYKFVHYDRKYSDPEQLENRPNYLLLNRVRVHISIAHRRQRRQHKIQTLDQLILRRSDRVNQVQVFFAGGPPQIELNHPVPFLWLLDRPNLIKHEVGQPVPDKSQEVGGDADGDHLVQCFDQISDLACLGYLHVSGFWVVQAHNQINNNFFWNKIAANPQNSHQLQQQNIPQRLLPHLHLQRRERHSRRKQHIEREEGDNIQDKSPVHDVVLRDLFE